MHLSVWFIFSCLFYCQRSGPPQCKNLLSAHVWGNCLCSCSSTALGVPLDIIQWDICSLPLRTGSVDVVVTDMPFGKRWAVLGRCCSLLPRLGFSPDRCWAGPGGEGVRNPMVKMSLKVTVVLSEHTNVWDTNSTEVVPVITKASECILQDRVKEEELGSLPSLPDGDGPDLHPRDRQGCAAYPGQEMLC